MFLRPSSPTRRNRPHPPQVFLVSRLHHIPGYHNADTTVGRDAYRVDASLPVDLREQRLAARQKYVGRQNGAWGSSFKDPKEQFAGRSRQAAEAWLKIADEKDHEKVFNAIHEDEERERNWTMNQSARSKTAYPSLTRWLRYAGARESSMFDEVTQSLEARRDKGYRPPSSPNPFHGRSAISDISSTHSPGDYVSYLKVRF
ncbi:uncharacterized protein LOC143283792 [Babylonia areolata]|uniref:uncharacterized protein LOC143283792 n=1 Tax=Babylonia areolata TaxID=304850 RepID=UPI003FD1F20B